MHEGLIELRSGTWRWSVAPSAEEDARTLVRFRSENGGGEMEVPVEADDALTEHGVAELVGRASVRRFIDGVGVAWTAEVKRPRLQLSGHEPTAPMVLFWCAERACLATLAPSRNLSELTTEELRAYLRMCLEG